MALTLDQASELAARAHAGQVDRAGRPYTEHVFAVRDLLVGRGEHAQIAGVLHDVLEDTGITADDLRARGCPEEAVRAVLAVSRRPGEAYDDLIARAAADPLGRLVKLADNAHNSDEARLAALPAAQAERLRAKYARARAVLEGAESRGSLVVVFTPDPDACRAFYEGLGLRFVRERHGSGPEHHAAVLAGGLVLELYPATEKRTTGALRLGFAVPARRTDPALAPGRYTFTDPDGRPVDVLVE
ncbi:hypothetical protein SUDANB121_05218 [Nocardiopsis dassonvillei]|uniref:VOC family protein n=1 Tax=Nocardiopsis dassonvillei TaxID=2014 RepID=UPI003F55336A